MVTVEVQYSHLVYSNIMSKITNFENAVAQIGHPKLVDNAERKNTPVALNVCFLRCMRFEKGRLKFWGVKLDLSLKLCIKFIGVFFILDFEG